MFCSRIRALPHAATLSAPARRNLGGLANFRVPPIRNEPNVSSKEKKKGKRKEEKKGEKKGKKKGKKREKKGKKKEKKKEKKMMQI